MDHPRAVPPFRFFEYLASVLAYVIIRLLSFTYRITEVGTEHRRQAASMHSAGSYIFASWHEFVIVAVIVQSRYRLLSLASRNFGGKLSGYILRKFGYGVVYGSQRSGGKDAREALLDGIKQGESIAILPDASTGPRRVPKPGTVYLAKKSGAAILPFHVHCDRAWRLNTWDRLMLPKPFAKITCVYGAPLSVDGQSDDEAFATAQRTLQAGLSGEPLADDAVQSPTPLAEPA